MGFASANQDGQEQRSKRLLIRTKVEMMTEEYIIDMMEDIELSPEPPPTQPLIEADASASAVAEDVDQAPDQQQSSEQQVVRNDERSISKASMSVLFFSFVLCMYLVLVLGATTYKDRGVVYRVVPPVIVTAVFMRNSMSRHRARSTAAAFLYGICPYRSDTLRGSAKEWLARETWEVICETTRGIVFGAISCLKVFGMLSVLSIMWSFCCLVLYIILRPVLIMVGSILAWEILRSLEFTGYINEWDLQGKFVDCFTSPKGSTSWCEDFQGIIQLASAIALLGVLSVIALVLRLLLSSVDIFGEQSYYTTACSTCTNRKSEHELIVV